MMDANNSSPSPEKNQVSGKVLSIIRNDLMQTFHDPNKVQQNLGALGVLLKNPKNKLVEMGENVFLVQVKDVGNVEVSILGNKDLNVIAQNFVKLLKYLKNIGVKSVKMFSSSDNFVAPAKQAGVNVTVKQSQQVAGNKASPAYEYSVML